MRLIFFNIFLFVVSLLASLILVDAVSIYFSSTPTTLEKWDHLVSSNFFDDTYLFHPEIGYVKDSLLKEEFKSSESYNVLFIGDSVTDFGSFPQLAYASASAELNGTEVNYINFGTMGYDLALQIRLLNETKILENTNLVVLQLSPNDLHGTPVIIKRADGSLTAFEATKKGAMVNQWLMNKSNLYKQYIFYKLNNLKDNYNQSLLEEKFFNDLNILKKMLEDNSIEYIVIFFKHMSHEEYSDWTYNATIKAIDMNKISENQIVDLYKRFQWEFENTEFKEIKSDDSHFNKLGNEKIGEVLGKEISRIFSK